MIRQTVYQFRSIVADTFRHRSVLLAGDAAHVMPPFLGQGMSSGIRDAATLGWMLDLVLTGAADPKLLDLYTLSRRPQVIDYVEESVRVGTVVCETDPCARRDVVRRCARRPSFRHRSSRLSARASGRTTAGRPLGRTAFSADERREGRAVRRRARPRVHPVQPGRTGRGDDRGHLGTHARDRAAVHGGWRRGVQEEGEALSDWLRESGVVAVLVRPDFYVFGTATGLSEVVDLLASLRVSLSLV
ncbi:FAD-dependent monooxygenase [Streptomyces sp. M19]